ncbi:MAG: hypothetical protein ACLFRP_00490 [Puniceicoccaceae bacterium]
MSHRNTVTIFRALAGILAGLGLAVSAVRGQGQDEGVVQPESTTVFDVAFGAPTFVDPSAFRGMQPGYHAFNEGETAQLRAPYRIYKDQTGETIEIQYSESDSLSSSREEQRMRATFQRYVEVNEGVLSTSRITDIKVERALVIHAEYLIEYDQKRTTILGSGSTLSGVGNVDSAVDPLPSASRAWVPAFEPVEPSVTGVAPVPQTASNEVVQGERLAVTRYQRNLWPVNYGVRFTDSDSYIETQGPPYDLVELSNDAGTDGFTYEFVFFLEQDEFQEGKDHALMAQGPGIWLFSKNSQGDLELRFAERSSAGVIDRVFSISTFPGSAEGWVTLALTHEKIGTDEYYINPKISTAPGENGTSLDPGGFRFWMPTTPGYGGDTAFSFGEDQDAYPPPLFFSGRFASGKHPFPTRISANTPTGK